MKVLWYLPIVPKFKRLFANGDDTKDLTCVRRSTSVHDRASSIKR